ncbi:MAG: DUF58 domain-containing protein [Actinomycetota bacterium]
MTLHATSRLVTAVGVAGAGLLIAVLGGRPEAALLAMPWLALLALGLAGGGPDRIGVRLSTSIDRVVVGGSVSVDAAIDGLDGGWVEAIWRPPAGFAAVTSVRGPGEGQGRPAGPGEDAGGRAGPAGDHDTGDLAGDSAGQGASNGDDSHVDGSVEGRMPDQAGHRAVGDVADPAGRVELSCTLPAGAWGTHDVGQVEIRVHHRHGLTVSRGLARQELPVRVHPRPIDLRHLLAPWHVRRLTGAHRSRAAARGVEYADIRPYGPGDSPRNINWRASARAQELLVSQRHPDRSTHAVLLIDSFGDAGYDLPAVLGDTIEAAMALAETHLTVSDRVGLIDLGGVVRWVTPGSGRHHLQRLVDALLATRLLRSEADRSVAVLPPRALPPRSFVVALSPLIDRRFVDALFTLRAAGHDVAVVELTPDLGPDDELPEEGTSAAVALRIWQAERAAARGRLAEAGVAAVRRQLRARSATSEGDGAPESWDITLATLAAARRRSGPVVRR